MNLENVIRYLLRLSNGKTMNVPLPDDALLDEYQKNIGFTFSDDYRKIQKEISNVFWSNKPFVNHKR